MSASLGASPVQMKALDQALVQFRVAVMRRAGVDVHSVAAQGMEQGGGSLPHAAQIQKAFGRHDVSQVTAHTGQVAQQATARLGARAYASGDSVVLGERGTDLHTVAHEAAHVVQQRVGVQLKGGIGAASDAYEQQADAVADAVVRGESAEGLLSVGPTRALAASSSLQLKEDKASPEANSANTAVDLAQASIKWIYEEQKFALKKVKKALDGEDISLVELLVKEAVFAVIGRGAKKIGEIINMAFVKASATLFAKRGMTYEAFKPYMAAGRKLGAAAEGLTAMGAKKGWSSATGSGDAALKERFFEAQERGAFYMAKKLESQIIIEFGRLKELPDNEAALRAFAAEVDLLSKGVETHQHVSTIAAWTTLKAKQEYGTFKKNNRAKGQHAGNTKITAADMEDGDFILALKLNDLRLPLQDRKPRFRLAQAQIDGLPKAAKALLAGKQAHEIKCPRSVTLNVKVHPHDNPQKIVSSKITIGITEGGGGNLVEAEDHHGMQWLTEYARYSSSRYRAPRRPDAGLASQGAFRLLNEALQLPLKRIK